CGWSSLFLHGESELSEHPYGARLPALEVTGAKPLARGELVSCAQDRFRWVAAFFPGQLISRGGSETMLGEEPLRPQPVVLLYRAQHVSTRHAVPGHHGFILQDRYGLHFQPRADRWGAPVGVASRDKTSGRLSRLRRAPKLR